MMAARKQIISNANTRGASPPWCKLPSHSLLVSTSTDPFLVFSRDKFDSASSLWKSTRLFELGSVVSLLRHYMIHLEAELKTRLHQSLAKLQLVLIQSEGIRPRIAPH